VKPVKKILLPAALYTLGFWNQLFFWVTVVAGIKLWLEHRRQLTKDKVKITINGKEYYAKDITITDKYLFLDGKCICPTQIESITIGDQ
jgi:hypothetical protein